MNKAALLTLIRQIKKGDEKAFEDFFVSLYQKCQPPLIAYTKSKDEAHEATIEAIFKFRKRFIIAEHPLPNTNIDGYIFMVAKNYWRDKQRKKVAQNTFALNPEDVEDFLAKNEKLLETETFDVLVQQEEFTAAQDYKAKRITTILKAFKALGQKCQQLLEGYILQKIKLKELQSQLGYSTYNSIKAAKYNCQKELEKKFNHIDKA